MPRAPCSIPAASLIRACGWASAETTPARNRKRCHMPHLPPHLPPRTWGGCLAHTSPPWSRSRQLSSPPSLSSPAPWGCCPRHRTHPAQHQHRHQIRAVESSQKTSPPLHCSALFLSHRSIGKKSLPTPAACLPCPCCPPCSSPDPEFTTELKLVDNHVRRASELLSAGTATSPAPAPPGTAAPRYHLHGPRCLQGAAGHPSPATTAERPWRWLLVLPLPHPPAGAA